MEVINTGLYDNETSGFLYLEDLVTAHWLQHIESGEYMILAREGQGFDSYGTDRDEEMLFALDDKTLSDDALMREKGWRVLPTKGRLFCETLGHIFLDSDDMKALEEGLKSALTVGMSGRAGTELKSFTLDPEMGTLTVNTDKVTYVDMGFIEDYLDMPRQYSGSKAA